MLRCAPGLRFQCEGQVFAGRAVAELAAALRDSRIDSFADVSRMFGLARTADLLAPELVEGAIIDPSCGGNPIELTKDNLTQLFHAAL